LHYHAGAQTAPATKPDSLQRDTPQSAVTAFLEACRARNYQTASEYLDLRALPANVRSRSGPELAMQLEAILNSDSQLNVLNLSRVPEGDLSNRSDPTREQIGTIQRNGESYPLSLERVTLQPGGPAVWLFSSDTVSAIPQLAGTTETTPWLAHYLPPVLVKLRFIETPLWKWIVLLLAALVMLSLSRQIDRLISFTLGALAKRFKRSSALDWVDPLIRPVRVLLCLAVYKVAVEIVNPSAIARLYLGRVMLLIMTWSVAWSLITVVDLFLDRMETMLESRHRFSSGSLIHLGRRAAKVTIIIFAFLLVLSNWGYNTSTLVAGLGVGGIAVALAAQQTIANVFGGVSVIGDHPVRIGDSGKFGDLIGRVEDIGMRSTRIRTMNRTLVSVPNSSFAALNIENYSVRDKMLFSPTIAIKRSTPSDQVHGLISALEKMLTDNQSLEVGPNPVRITGLTSSALNIEIFCYVLTSNPDEFSKIQGELYLAINEAVKVSGVELA
jgi:MscS family membrane protein